MQLSIENLSKAYGDNEVLNQVTFSLNSGHKRGLGQKIGVVGANGVGKSTLLKIIVGELVPDAGRVHYPADLEIGYLPQVLQTAAQQTIDGFIDSSLGKLKRLEVQLRQLEAEMAHANGNLDAIMERYGQVTERFEQRGGYDVAYRSAQIFAGLGIAHIDRSRMLETLSGGEKERVGLAALLLQAPDLLLLDEPTNHLDFATMRWLETYLRQLKGAVLVVSHDRHFLNGTVDAILEIVEHSREAKLYNGNYDFYAEMKVQERAKWVEQYWQQQEEIWELRRVIKGKARQVAHNRAPRDGDKMAYDHKGGRVEEAIARNVRAAEEKLRRLEDDPIPKPPQALKINPEFDSEALISRAPLTVARLSKAYGTQMVLRDVSFSLNGGERVVIVGPNGVGKSTLLKLIAGVEAPDSGDVYISSNAMLGYLDQEQETLSTAGTLFEAYRGERMGEWEVLKTEILQYGLFVYEDLAKSAATLSVGQKRKLQIACLIAQRANLLLLDEPTNHISLDVLEEFEQALLEFPGPILAVSHDRHFIDRFANEIWEIDNGHVRRFLGSWNQYQAAQKPTKEKYQDEQFEQAPEVARS